MDASPNRISSEESIFKNFIYFLNSKDIDYVLLGNVSGYPLIIDSDIDIAVSNDSFLKINSLIKEFSHIYGLLICNCFCHRKCLSL